MSNNPLKEFRTYSYFFVLGVCTNTRVAEEITGGGTMLSHAGSQTDVHTGPSGDYMILIDGSKHTNYFIEEASWTSYINPSAETNGESTINSAYLDGKIQVREPHGISFLNTLTNAARQLNSTPTSLVFFLKPYFVGNSADGKAKMLPNTRPYLFVLIDSVASITEAGAVYNLETIGWVDGAGKMPQFQSVSSGYSFQFERGWGLGRAFEAMEADMNAYYDELSRKMRQCMVEAGRGAEFDQQKPVRVRFRLDQHYGLGSYFVGTNETLVYKTDDKKDFIVSQGPTDGIEDLIRKVMDSSQEIIAENPADTEAESGKKYIRKYTYKIRSTVESYEDGYVSTYYINRYEILTEDPCMDDSSAPANNPGLVFDYFFTGKNTEVRRFDMKQESGLLFFHLLGSTDTLLDHTQAKVGQKGQPLLPSASGGSVDTQCTKYRNSPVAPGLSNSRDLITRNKLDPLSTSEYYANLRRWSSIDGLGVELDVNGNTLLLDDTSSYPSELGNLLEGTPGNYTKEGIGKGGLYVKVNVMFPADGGRNFPKPGTTFEQFWYDGWYYVISVEHIFSKGDFHQKIYMVSIPKNINVGTGATGAAACGDVASQAADASAVGPTRASAAASSSAAGSAISQITTDATGQPIKVTEKLSQALSDAGTKTKEFTGPITQTASSFAAAATTTTQAVDNVLGQATQTVQGALSVSDQLSSVLGSSVGEALSSVTQITQVAAGINRAIASTGQIINTATGFMGPVAEVASEVQGAAQGLSSKVQNTVGAGTQLLTNLADQGEQYLSVLQGVGNVGETIAAVVTGQTSAKVILDKFVLDRLPQEFNINNINNIRQRVASGVTNPVEGLFAAEKLLVADETDPTKWKFIYKGAQKVSDEVASEFGPSQATPAEKDAKRQIADASGGQDRGQVSSTESSVEGSWRDITTVT